MKAKLVMLMACLCIIFTSFNASAAPCDALLRNGSSCTYTVDVIWDCGGTYVTVTYTVNPGQSFYAPNPGNCTFYKAIVYDALGLGTDASVAPGITTNVGDCNGGLDNVMGTTDGNGCPIVAIYP